VSPSVIRAKLVLLQQVLADLKPNILKSHAEQTDAHYEIERQVQVAVDLCLAMARRLLFLKNLPSPDTAREVFVLLGKSRIIPNKLALGLAQTVGLRNLLVHEYGKIDYTMFFGGLKGGYKAFAAFAVIVSKKI